MRWRNTPEQWGAVSKIFHWGLALLIVATAIYGLRAEDAPMGPPKFELFAIHKSLGLTVFVLMIARLGWRFLNPVPILPPALSGWERLAAGAAHWVLYGLFLAMPLSGWVVTSAANFPISFFGLFEVPLISGPDKALQENASLAHQVLFWAILGVVGIHAAAALRHHFLLKDDILKRMLPGN